MAQEDLKRAILERIQKKREEILNQARVERDEVLRQTRAEASILKEKALKEIEGDCLLKKTRNLSQVSQEVKERLLEAREKRILDVLTLVKEDFKAVRQDKSQYKVIFKGLLGECLEGLDKKIKLKLKVDPRDKELAMELLEDLGLNAQLEAKGDIGEGLILSDLEEKLIISNTIASRLEKLKTELRLEISKILFINQHAF